MTSIAHAFLFIHRGKSGGNSVSEALLPYAEDRKTVTGSQDGTERLDVESERFGTRKHARLAEYRRAVPPELFGRLYKFSTIRNPFERLVSACFSPHRVANGKVTGFDRTAFRHLITHHAMLRDFIRTTPPGETADGALDAELDRLMRVGCLAEDFAVVTRAIGIGTPVAPHRNRGEHGQYRRHYDAELRRIVETRFRKELDWGSYTF